jgi:hypothetical protein
MIVDLCHHGSENKKCAKLLSPKSLRERLELFQIIKYVFGSSSICELYLPQLAYLYLLPFSGVISTVALWVFTL